MSTYPQIYNTKDDTYVNVRAKVIGPTKLFSASYTMWNTANKINWPSGAGQLNRGAKSRTFFFVNNMNAAITTLQIEPYDSAANDGSATYGLTVNFYAPEAGAKSYKTSETDPGLAAHVDSIVCTVQIGATVPTSGTLDLYVTEIF